MALFVTCMVDTLYPDVGVAAVVLLERAGARVTFPDHQTCCGQPAYNSGHWPDARAVAVRYLDTFGPLVERGAVDAIVAPSGSCIAMVTHGYEALFEEAGSDRERERVRLLRGRTYELTQYLTDVLGVREVDSPVTGRVAYHPCCHLLRELQVDAQPKALLGALPYAEIVDLPGAEECCGFGGLFALKNAPISAAMGARKARHLEECGAEVVAVCDVSCMTHLNGILARAGSACRATHIAELLFPPSEPGAGAAV